VTTLKTLSSATSFHAINFNSLGNAMYVRREKLNLDAEGALDGSARTFIYVLLPVPSFFI
jgi:hypothetical protein